jgi:DNA primase
MDNLLDELEELLDGCHKYDKGDKTYLSACCVFHEDSRPSLIVHSDTYNCLSCGAHGTTQSLLEKLSKSPIVQTHKQDFHNPFTRWLQQDKYVEKSLIRAWQALTTNPWQGSYLHNRGIDAETCKKFGIGYRENWFTFPLKNKLNSIIGAVARAGEDNNSPSKYVVPAGQNPNLIYIPSLRLIENSDKIFLTFGILDALSLVVCDIAAMSTTNGKHISLSALNEYKPKQIIILPDRGEESEAYEIAAGLGWKGKVKRLAYPEGLKDCNDVLKVHGRTTLTKLILE